jgi:hypothetical protein
MLFLGGLDPAVGTLDMRYAELVAVAVEGSVMPLARAQAFLDPEVLGRDLDRVLDRPSTPCSRSRDSLLNDGHGTSFHPHNADDDARTGRGGR